MESETEFTTGLSQTFSVNYSAISEYINPLYFAKEVMSEFLAGEIITEFDTSFKIISLDSQLLILSPDFELLAYIENYEDFVWNRRWRKVDDYELTVDKSKPVSRFLQADNYVVKKQGDLIHAGRI
ncbi:MAG: Gp37-like protein, partial [bacterium]